MFKVTLYVIKRTFVVGILLCSAELVIMECRLQSRSEF